MSFLAYVGTILWCFGLAVIGVAAAERQQWRVVGMVVLLLVATGLVVVAVNVMSA